MPTSVPPSPISFPCQATSLSVVAFPLCRLLVVGHADELEPITAPYARHCHHAVARLPLRMMAAGSPLHGMAIRPPLRATAVEPPLRMMAADSALHAPATGPPLR